MEFHFGRLVEIKTQYIAVTWRYVPVRKVLPCLSGEGRSAYHLTVADERGAVFIALRNIKRFRERSEVGWCFKSRSAAVVRFLYKSLLI